MAALLPRVKRVSVVAGALLALWALSFGLSYADLGRVALPIALAIAVTKALLVVLFFMELLHERASMKVALVAALVLAATLIGLMVADVATREDAPPQSSPRTPS